MSNKNQVAKKSKKQKRSLYTIELPPELRPKLQRIADANSLTLAVVTRMCVLGGLPSVETKLTELREPALPS